MTREERKEAIEILKTIAPKDFRGNGKVFTKLIVIKAISMAIKALEQEPCDNAVSRQDVLDLAKKGVLISNGNYGSVCKAINELPPVTSQLKTGHWISGKYKDTCSRCRCTYPKNIGFKNYCPSCGAKMVEPQESEGK